MIFSQGKGCYEVTPSKIFSETEHCHKEKFRTVFCKVEIDFQLSIEGD